MTHILLDTCAVIWIGFNQLPERVVANLQQMMDDGAQVFMSPVTTWEIGLLASRGRLALSISPQAWLERFVQTSQCRSASLPADTLIASSFLPGTPPSDPADRIIIATARAFGCRIMTRDRKILDYADQDHVQAIAC